MQPEEILRIVWLQLPAEMIRDQCCAAGLLVEGSVKPYRWRSPEDADYVGSRAEAFIGRTCTRSEVTVLPPAMMAFDVPGSRYAVRESRTNIAARLNDITFVALPAAGGAIDAGR